MIAWEVFADEWTAFDRTAPVRGTQKEAADDGRLFIADIDAIRDVWSVPSAFAAYRDYLTGR
jgi:hypothetical protein